MIPAGTIAVAYKVVTNTIYLIFFTQIDFWKPDSVTQIKPHSTVDFRVKAEDISTVEDFLEQNELQYE